MRNKTLKAISLALGLALLIASGPICHAESASNPIPDSEVSGEAKAKAKKIATQVLTDWNKGIFSPLPTTFTAKMRQALTPSAQENAYNQIKPVFGEFQSMSFVEAVQAPGFPGLIVYRFKASFSRTKDRPEIRVVLNRSGKVSGLWLKPWRNKLQ